MFYDKDELYVVVYGDTTCVDPFDNYWKGGGKIFIDYEDAIAFALELNLEFELEKQKESKDPKNYRESPSNLTRPYRVKSLDQALRDRIESERSDAWDDGHGEGYNEGKSEGYEQGWSDGKEDGEKTGYETGYDEGYSEGFTEGKKEGEANVGI